MKKILEKWFGLYKTTVQLRMTTYHYPVERKGRLTGLVQHRVSIHNDWVDGVHPKIKKGCTHEK